MMLPRSLDEIRGLRAARWIRESTTGQFDRYGPASQREQQDRFIERHELVDTGLVWQVAQSGTTVWRSEAMAEMVQAARDGAFDLLLTGYADRWQRNLRRTLELLEDGLHPAGVALVMCDRRILSSDPHDWDELISEAHQADRYSRRLGERISDGYAAKFQRLGDQAGNASWGLRRAGEAHTLELDPDTIGDVVTAFERYAAGNVTHDILAEELGVGVEQVRKALRNPIYNGWAVRHRGRDRSPAPWRADPPVSDELWERVQAMREIRTHGGPKPGQWRRGLDPLGGLLWCVCGARVRTNGTAGQPPRRQRIHPASACAGWGGYRTTWGAIHDLPITLQIQGLQLGDSTIERVVRAVRSLEDAGQPPTVDGARLARRRRELALAHAGGRLGDLEYLDQVASLRDEGSHMTTRPTPVTAERAVSYLRDLPMLWGRANEEERAELLHAIYARIEVTRDGFASVKLTPDAYAHGLALALPVTVVASPAGARAGTTVRRIVRIPIVGRRTWLRLARSA